MTQLHVMMRSLVPLLLPCLLVAALHLRSTGALPSFWANRSPCATHPAQAYAAHNSPVPDTASAFFLALNHVEVESICPEQKYTIMASFAEVRHAYVTISVGSFAHANSPLCKAERYTTAKVQQFAFPVTIPCSITTSNVTIGITSAVSTTAAYEQIFKTYELDSRCTPCGSDS